MAAYYNEIEPYAAEWLRNLIQDGHIAEGVVDERSIEDVTPGDLAGFTQCHFFAGIALWSLALRSAGWSDDRPVWTGSCPCQPFSQSGKGKGFADERHLWPAWFHLIEQCRPASVFGEQVASKAVDPWIDLVQDDLEALGYRFGAVPFPSAGVGAPHIRDRTYWVADAADSGRERRGTSKESNGRNPTRLEPERFCDAVRLALSNGAGRQPGQRHDTPAGHRDTATPARDDDRHGTASPTNGFWRDADWLFCRDGKWRPVEPESSALAVRYPDRVGKLCAYGNAINAEQAKIFIEEVMHARALVALLD